LENCGQERNRRQSNKWDIISIQQKNEIFAELHEQAERMQGSNILNYNENENTRTSEQAERRRVLICDDERDLLLMFTIALQESYDVLTAKTGEECIKNTLMQKIREERLT
jgi:hypothetical protein